MFGHQDDQSLAPADGHDDPATADQTATTDSPSPSLDTSTQSSDNGQNIVEETLGSPLPEPALPAVVGHPENEKPLATDVFSPAGGYPTRPTLKVQPGVTQDSAAADKPSVDTANKDDGLLSIKQDALEELLPLVDKLDQTPEERFKTLMMLIQASDNQGLIEAAFKAAHAISDEKVKAQALLDVVNEINYFTHPPENPKV